ncbi:MAG TPA: excinuclease ABC subunit UvrA [Spirochaetota bacterium]|nr:excinuclease ABC subunit UvrA [Spirochaetota bacterium]HOR43291.1 excinuclease ABC subunit UvrA [Spirochaetota bacterium]HPK54960.1 excinuclease ABC subunit UvrA [Spirochaetota bacterium]
MSHKFKSFIKVRGAREHNLKNISVDIPRDSLVVITGLSGSGKSSLAFDTIYAEGQRRYVESLSAYARQFLGLMEKPDVDFIDGLSPAISIEQKSSHRNPRSTVGTVTEIHDYYRLLFARIGIPYCHKCGKKISSMSVDQIVENIMTVPENTKLVIMAPVVRGRKGEHSDIIENARKKGFARVRIDGEIKSLEEEIKLSKNIKHNIDIVVDRIVMKDGIRPRLADSLETSLDMGSGLTSVLIDDNEKLFSSLLSCIDCGISIPELTPRLFSFNAPYGACDECSGLGFLMRFDEDLIVPDKTISIEDGAVLAWGKQWTEEQARLLNRTFSVDTSVPWKKLPKNVTEFIMHGTADARTKPYPYNRAFEGVIPNLERRYKETSSEDIRGWMEGFMHNQICPSCNGARLKPEVLSIKVADRSIHDVSSMSIKNSKIFFDGLKLTPTEEKIAFQILKEIRQRLNFLNDVGLDYLTLDRAAGTLSGGEAQRIRLATQIGSALTGVLYVLDEPSIGLHQRDNDKLIATLKRLKELGNTVIVVEHDEDTMHASDYIIDLGPGAGEAGGHLIACGTAQEIMKNNESVTGRFLSGKEKIDFLSERRKPVNYITIKGASENNLRNVDVKFPLGVFTSVTGVSGSGKSTLVMEIFYKALSNLVMRSKEYPGKFKEIIGWKEIDKVIDIDQSPIGRTPRSNPATYTGIFTPIRDLFASLQDSKIRGYSAGRFSFNVRGGRCESCEGDGVKKIEMHFLPDVYITCEVCHGKRYNHETLEIRFKGKNIFEILDMSVDEAAEFFKNIPSVYKKLETLQEVGLGYIKLGQSATTLSGGEAQRIKLATELSKRSTGKTLYILDEPTTGLHFADVKKLLHVLHTLVEKGNTVIVIEHNLDVIKTSDHIIDLGPEGGDGGGTVVAEGRPEDIIKVKESYTGKFLKRVLNK